jgi:hypothetical protein
MQRSVEYADFERIIEALRREFRHSIDGAQATGKKVTTIAENVIAALKPIEAALSNHNSRLVSHGQEIVDLEQRFKSMLYELEARLNSNPPPVYSLTKNVSGMIGFKSPSGAEQPVVAGGELGSNGRDGSNSPTTASTQERVQIMSVEISNGKAHAVEVVSNEPNPPDVQLSTSQSQLTELRTGTSD